MSQPANQPSKKFWTRGGFLIAVFILAVSAIGLNVAISALQLTLKKEPVPLSKALTTLPTQIGPWLQVSKDEPLDKEVQDSLATKEYIFRDYVDTRLVNKATLAAFDGRGSIERRNLLGQLQRNQPDAVINLAVTYYTGLVDTVAHIPERCMVADGYQPSTHETVSWNLKSAALPEGGTAGALDQTPAGQNLELRFINFEDQTDARRVTKRVAYCFFVNGHFESDPVGVRTTLADLRTRHGFYSKIELLSIIPDHDRCESVMTDFLTVAMPEIQKCYPDWNKVEGRGVKK